MARALAVGFLLIASFETLAQQCPVPAARVVSIQGSIELRHSGAQNWQAARSGAALCSGDSVHVGQRSRAALLLPNETTLRLDQGTTLTLSAPDQAQASLLDLILGTIHVISRTPRPFRVNTPYLNAGVEGTEFLVGSDEAGARLAVFEGRVSASSGDSSLMLVGGEIAYAAKGVPLRKERMLRPADAVQWALYYPTLFDHRLGEQIAGTPGEAALRESIVLYRQDRLAEAIFRLDKAPEGLANPRFLTYRAGLLLLVGRADEAGSDIERALAVDAANSSAHALKSVVALTQNDKDQALKLATQAVELDQTSPVARLALSYAQQAHFKIEEALASVQTAVDLDPQNALAWARLAELHMSTGYLDRALEAAKRAVSLNPELAKTQSVLGFANLTRIDTQAAKLAFQRAIDLDQADPLPRLGLGLAMIREGDLTAGREQLEIAVCLDPENSLLRSYVGKAYYEEKRDKLAGIQFDLAKERDPRDPTPWFYDAIRKQTENRPVEAMEELQRSIALNDDRAVYRSRLLLDQDNAARGVSLARAYQELGFDRLGLLEATKSLSREPRDYSAHRFLGDVFSNLPRHEIVRTSELLQSQLRQPLSVVPVEPDLADDRQNALKAGVLRGAGPGQPGFSEYSRLFEGNRLSTYASAVVGSHQTVGDQLLFSGIQDSLSFSMGQFHYETDGLKDPSALRRDIYTAFVQANIAPLTSVQAEIRHRDTVKDDAFFLFDPVASRTVRTKERVTNARLGARYSPVPSGDLILSSVWQTRAIDSSAVASPETRTLESRAVTLEAQYSFIEDGFALTVGGGRSDVRDSFVAAGFATNLVHDNAYLYGRVSGFLPSLALHFGLSADSLKFDEGTRHYLSPKLGLLWSITPSTTVRAASFQSVKRPLIANQTIEPTQIAGFSQFFDDPNGARARREGFGVDHRFGGGIYAGAEASRRRLGIRVEPREDIFAWRERTNAGYIYWAIPRDRMRTVLGDWSLAVHATAEYERIDRDAIVKGLEGIVNLRTYVLPLGARFFYGQSLSAELTATYVDQQGQLLARNAVPTSDRFWLADLTMTYKFSSRRGELRIGIRNLSDRRFDFVEIDRTNPRFAAERFMYAQALLLY